MKIVNLFYRKVFFFKADFIRIKVRCKPFLKASIPSVTSVCRIFSKYIKIFRHAHGWTDEQAIVYLKFVYTTSGVGYDKEGVHSITLRQLKMESLINCT